jgi:hypothetical protein
MNIHTVNGNYRKVFSIIIIVKIHSMDEMTVSVFCHRTDWYFYIKVLTFLVEYSSTYNIVIHPKVYITLTFFVLSSLIIKNIYLEATVKLKK